MSFELKLSISNKKAEKTIAKASTDNKEFFVNLIEDTKEEDDLDAVFQIKKNTFKTYIKKDKKLTIREINNLIDAYDKGLEEIDNDKLSRRYDMAVEFVNDSLKKFLTYGPNTKLFPVVDDKKPFSLYVTGMRSSGKSYFTREFLKQNKRRDTQIFLISPFEDDPSLKGLTLIKFNLGEIEEVLERQFTVFDFPENAIIVFDDIEGFSKPENKKMNELRDQCLTVGRHVGDIGLSVISIVHNPMSGNSTKVPLRESTYFCLFPKSNPRDVRVLLKTYAGYTEDKINEILNTNSRWCFVSKTVPSYWISERQVRLLQ